MEKIALLISEKDNVATVISELVKKGDIINCKTKKVKALEDIRFGHKVALKDIEESDYIIKYGEPIGKATKNIKVGEYVHTHNVENLK